MGLYNREIFYIQVLDLNKLFLQKQKIVCRIKLIFSPHKRIAIKVDLGVCLFDLCTVFFSRSLYMVRIIIFIMSLK